MVKGVLIEVNQSDSIVNSGNKYQTVSKMLICGSEDPPTRPPIEKTRGTITLLFVGNLSRILKYGHFKCETG